MPTCTVGLITLRLYTHLPVLHTLCTHAKVHILTFASFPLAHTDEQLTHKRHLFSSLLVKAASFFLLPLCMIGLLKVYPVCECIVHLIPATPPQYRWILLLLSKQSARKDCGEAAKLQSCSWNFNFIVLWKCCPKMEEKEGRGPRPP